MVVDAVESKVVLSGNEFKIELKKDEIYCK